MKNYPSESKQIVCANICEIIKPELSLNPFIVFLLWTLIKELQQLPSEYFLIEL